MATNQTEELIVDLVADLAPVQRLAPVSIRMIRWLAVALITSVVAVWFIGLRADMSHAMATRAVLLSLGLAIATFASAAVVALRLSVPGADQSVRWRWLPVTTTAIWIAALVLWAGDTSGSWRALRHEPFHAACIFRVIAIAVIPTVLLVREVRRGFALDVVSATALAALGGSAVAAMAVQLVCPIDRPAHLLVSHVLPVLGIAVAAAAVSGVARLDRT